MLCNTILLTYFIRDGDTLDDELLTIEQVASVLQLHPDTIRRYIREKKLKAVRISATSLRVRRSELDKFIKERETDKDAGTD
jgi:excisionase family DNA binding protein